MVVLFGQLTHVTINMTHVTLSHAIVLQCLAHMGFKTDHKELIV